MRAGVVVVLAVALCACSSSKPKLAAPPHVTSFAVQSSLVGRQLYGVLVTPAGGGEGRPLLVFLHGYGASPSDTLSPAFTMALRRLGDDAPVVLLPEGDTGWWHNRQEGKWGSYVLREAIPAALRRSGADPHRVAIGGISMGGFGALDIGRRHGRFCAVGGHSPAIWTSASETAPGAFDDAADFARNDVVALARARGSGLTRGGGHARRAWIDSGDADPFVAGDRALAAALGVPKRTWPGAHDAAYWRAHYRDYLRFYAAAVERC